MTVAQLAAAVYPGITQNGTLEMIVVTLNIDEGEEILLDYGNYWEDAWNHHVANWKPINGNSYEYPSELEIEDVLHSIKGAKWCAILITMH